MQSRVIHELRSDFKLSVLLEATKFPKSTYMYWQKRFDRPNKDKSIEEAIKSIFEESKEAYGYRRVTAMVRKHGFIVNQKKVRRLMKKLNLKCVSFTRKSRKYNSYKGNVGTVVPNRIKQRFSTKIPYQKITTDTSEFKIYTTNTSGKVMIKKAYFDVFLDMYNGEVLSYRLSERPNAQAINDALREAIEITRICPYRRTFHSDQGWAYQMKQYSNTLKENRIFQSMSRKGTCLDNSPMENFFGLLKQEMYYGKTYTSFEELNNAINNYIYFYNNKRIKEKL
ncbi:IS3 family transposase, partial [Clostridium sporogenes]|uniref:IS3 family transposase n=1 Tax=Clostridium sporogenes TaxID=1509 RepID=UPI003F8EB1A1